MNCNLRNYFAEKELRSSVLKALRSYADKLEEDAASSRVQYRVESFRILTNLDEVETAIASGNAALIVVAAAILRYLTSTRRITAKGEETAYELSVCIRHTEIADLLRAGQIVYTNLPEDLRELAVEVKGPLFKHAPESVVAASLKEEALVGA